MVISEAVVTLFPKRQGRVDFEKQTIHQSFLRKGHAVHFSRGEDLKASQSSKMRGRGGEDK